ncbi:MAG: RNA 2',3'-cyclic phosphodiesterase [Chloroflexota bacterium]
MAQVRTFIALELPDEVKAALAQVQTDLRAAAQRRQLPLGAALKWVEPEGIHLTLQFLGGVETDLVPDIERAVEEAGAGVSAPGLGLQTVGAFPNPRQPLVLWVGLAGDVYAVAELQQRVRSNLGNLGFAPEARPFSPHLTLARLREQASQDERRAVATLVATGVPVPAVTFVARRLNVMKSELHPAGARYSALHTIVLVD